MADAFDCMRAAHLIPSSYNEAQNTIRVRFATEHSAIKYDWRTDTVYREVLPLAGMDLSRLRNGIHFLKDHGLRENGFSALLGPSIDDVLGSTIPGTETVQPGTPSSGDGFAEVDVRLSTNPVHAGLIADIRNGVIVEISYAYQKNGKPEVSQDPDGTEVRTWWSHTPTEISAVAISANHSAGIRAATVAARSNTEETMREPTPKPEVPANAAPVGVEPVARAVDIAARNAEIRALARQAGCAQELIDNLCDNASATIEESRAAVQADWFKRMTANPPSVPNTKGHVGVTVDEADTRAQAMVDRITGSTEGAAGELRDATAYELAKRSLEIQGIRTAGRTRTEIAQMALRAYGGMTTGSLPNIFGTAANTILMRGYTRQPATWEAFCQRADQNTLDTVTAVAMDEVATVRDIPEGGEYTVLKTSDRAETFVLSKSGGIVPITVEMILGDKLGQMATLAERLGASMRRYQANAVYGQVTGNPVMGDGVNLFDAAHNNVATSTGAPSAARIAELQQLILMQTVPAGDDEEFIGTPMRFLLVPVALEFATRQLLYGGYNPTSAANAVTDDQRNLRLISDPRLDASSTAHWYGVGDPSLTDTLHYGWLSGTGGPETSQYEDPGHDAFVLKARQFFFAKAMNFRAFAYNAG